MSVNAYGFPPYRLVLSERRLLNQGVPMKLGARAFDVLVSLIERRDRTVSKQELMDLVWPRLVVEENNLQVHVVALRKLLGHAAVVTVPGRGYRFTLPVTVDGIETSERQAERVDEVPSAIRCTNLPSWIPPLYGREESLSSLLSLVKQHDLVTVVGPAGIGKTRLAQAAAHARTSDGPVWWVDLSSVIEPGLVANAVATSIGIPVPLADVARIIAERLVGQGALLVLDNVEHLLEGVAEFLAELRPMVDHFRLLITSQEVLRAPGAMSQDLLNT